ncbi:MAG: 3'-5' exoribonuclease domain-containing protein [Anaerovoracaceae bacterium]
MNTKFKFEEPVSIIMIDIETLATTIDAEIAQVAAIHTLGRNQVGDVQIYTEDESDKYNFKRDPETLAWHKAHNTSVFDGRMFAQHGGWAKTLSQTIAKLNQLTTAAHSDTLIYCKGLSFDIPVLQYAANEVGLELHIPNFRNLRCLRTELATAKSLGFVPLEYPAAHHAYADCVQQLTTILFPIFDFYKTLGDTLNESCDILYDE